MVNILLAPDSFKGSISSRDVINVWSNALKHYPFPFDIESQPLSDGGEGFVTACCRENCKLRSVEVSGPLHKPVKVNYGLDDNVAFIEMAASSGIELLAENELNPMAASTYGLGQTIRDALDQGARRVYIGLGGSATHDAGMGMLRALGARFFNGEQEVSSFEEVKNISFINLDKVIQLFNNVEVICAADVSNPLTGKQGAAHVYAAQKGATPGMIAQLEELTAIFADKIENYLGERFRTMAGTGAAGGTGFALIATMGAKMIPGFDVVAQITSLEERIRKADLVVTGEGYLDQQSSFGKAPVRLLQMARRYGVPVAGVFGGVGESDESFSRIYSLTDLAGSKIEAMNHPEKYLIQAIKMIAEPFTS